MKPINIFNHITSENVTRSKRVYKGVKIISLVSRGAKISNPVGLYVEASLAVIDALNQYTQYSKAKEVTKQISNSVVQLEEKISQTKSLIEMEKKKLQDLVMIGEEKISSLDNKIDIEREKYKLQKILLDISDQNMIDMKKYIENLRIENRSSSKIKSIEDLYIKAIASRNEALSQLISRK